MDNKIPETKSFLRDIGLDYYARKFEVAEAKNKLETANLVPFMSPHAMKMDDPITACYVHIENLVKTYGANIVAEAVNSVISGK